MDNNSAKNGCDDIQNPADRTDYSLEATKARDLGERVRVSDPIGEPPWRRNGLRYYPLGMYLKNQFGTAVRKISVDAHFSCPNIDGTVGRGGCIFCDAKSFSPGRRSGLTSVAEQIEFGRKQLARYQQANAFIAYFQPSTNTHGPLDYLESVYRQALTQPGVVGLAIGTRCDALAEPVLDLLERLSQETWISVEIGLQTTKNATLRFLNRGHDVETFDDCIARAKKHRLRLGTHVILGLPGETRDDMLETARRVAAWRFESVKLHHLYVVRNTPLETLWRRGEIQTLSVEQYAELAADFIERLPPETVIDRVSGEMSEEYLLAPAWTSQKHAARNALNAVLTRRDSWQGKLR